MTIRTIAQSLIDQGQFLFDVFPRLHYQPLPFIGIHKARRGLGTVDRWQSIEKVLSSYQVNSALDIGCNVGYFCFSMAQKGIATLGVDTDERSLRIARHVAGRLGLKRVGLCHLAVGPDTVNLLPTVDVVLLLSVWHHWVKEFGIQKSTAVLTSIWERCNQALFFETGEAEMPSDFGLPTMEPTPEQWLATYLAAACMGSQVECIGTFQAFAVGGDERRDVVFRHLFKVTRVSTGNEHQV